MTPAYPLTATVQVEAYHGEAPDRHGNQVPTFGAPRPEPVYGWAAPANEGVENLDGGERVRLDLQLYVPPTFDCSPRDRITVPDVGRFEVVGHPAYYQNPFAWTPGRVVQLQRIEG
jgi:hypothetical protein